MTNAVTTPAQAGAVNEAGASHSPFRPVVIIALILAAVFALSAMAALDAFSPELSSGNDGREHALSKSAVGYAGVVKLMRETGRPVLLSRGALGAVNDENLLVLTPAVGQETDTLDERRWSSQATLLILPKWQTIGQPFRKGWVEQMGQLTAGEALSVLPDDLRPDLAMASRSSNQPVVLLGPDDEPIGPPVTIQGLRTLSGPGWSPLVTVRGGGAVVLMHDDTGVMVVSDPDLLNTLGMDKPAKAQTALGLIDAVAIPDQAVVFDLTLHGFGRPRSILRLLLEPPLLGFTLCLLFAAGLVFWQAANRFAPHRKGDRAVALGKKALADNTAALVRLARRERSMARPYADLVRRQAAKAVAAPPNLSHDGLTQLLDRLARRQGVQTDFETLSNEADQARNAGDMMVVVRKLLNWKSEMTRGRG